MPDWAALCAVAYQRERVRARRLARTAALSEHHALCRILKEAAHPNDLTTLLQRRAELLVTEQLRKTIHKEAQRATWQRRRASETITAQCWHSWFDGSARPNPGQIGLGVLLRGPAGQAIELSLCGGFGDSSQAEYLALIALLEAACQQRVMSLLIHGDSRVVLDDVRATIGIPVLGTYRERARTLLAQIPEVELRWIPRLRNHAADALSQRARAAIVTP